MPSFPREYLTHMHAAESELTALRGAAARDESGGDDAAYLPERHACFKSEGWQGIHVESSYAQMLRVQMLLNAIARG